jgi:hypothetical protein
VTANGNGKIFSTTRALSERITAVQREVQSETEVINNLCDRFGRLRESLDLRLDHLEERTDRKIARLSLPAWLAFGLAVLSLAGTVAIAIVLAVT